MRRRRLWGVWRGRKLLRVEVGRNGSSGTLIEGGRGRMMEVEIKTLS